MSMLTAVLGELMQDVTHVRIFSESTKFQQEKELCNEPITEVAKWLPHILEYGYITTHRVGIMRDDKKTIVIIVTIQK